MTSPDPKSKVTLKPIAGNQRIESLDVLRGFALLGILVVNSLFFAMPMMPAFLPPWENYTGIAGSTSDWISWWIVSGFFQQIFDRITIDSGRDALAEAIARRVRDFE